MLLLYATNGTMACSNKCTVIHFTKLTKMMMIMKMKMKNDKIVLLILVGNLMNSKLSFSVIY